MFATLCRNLLMGAVATMGIPIDRSGGSKLLPLWEHSPSSNCTRSPEPKSLSRRAIPCHNYHPLIQGELDFDRARGSRHGHPSPPYRALAARTDEWALRDRLALRRRWPPDI